MPSGPPPASAGQSFVDRPGLWHTLPGRLLILSIVPFVLLSLVQRAVPLPEIVELFRKVVALASLAAGGWLAILAISRNRRAFLWRVRRKLILSYVLLGVVPLVLVVAFVATFGMLLYMTIAAYVFQDGLTGLTDDVRQIAETSAIEIGRAPTEIETAIERKYANLANRYPELSLAVVTADGPSGAPAQALIQAGAWRHARPPTRIPAWMTSAGDFAGTLVYVDPFASEEPRLLIRAAFPTPDTRRYVIADLPVDETIVARLADRTGTRLGAITASGCGVASTPREAPSRSIWSLYNEAVAFIDCRNWADGATGGVSVSLDAPVGRLTSRLSAVQSSELAATVGATWSTVFRELLVVLGVLFLIIQASAIVVGGALVRSITSAIHELFAGTERVRQGDFANRIRIESKDQLGDLAESFNRMSGSIEHLLHVQREKQRLDDELRIARDIQKSLLPVRPPDIDGLDVADLCEPAREVGGDYYDFFQLGPRQLGVLIADVAGKGTSAALYMAELKGLMLALSHAEPSPRKLLVDVNRRLSGHLDNRTFITMTYAVVDLDRGTLTSARAGHTPLILVSGGASRVVASDGMVLGLSLPNAADKFEHVLDEDVRRLAPGDVIVLYTDGVTEAMDRNGDLFGEAALSGLVASVHERNAAGIRERVVRDVKAFVGDAEPHDDMTMVIIKVGEAA